MGLFEDYFVAPIMEKTGYNLVNTLVYVAIAVIAVYLIFQIFKRYNVRIDKQFFWGTLTFVLFGSTARVVTDAVDGGVFTGVTPLHQIILDSGIYKYGFLTATPGIYIVVAAIFLSTFAILHCFKRMELLPWVGLALFAFNFLLLLPFMQYAWLAIPVFIMAGIPAYLIYRKYGKEAAAVVGGHALDGAATFVIIDIFPMFSGKNYFEQHVLSRAVGDLFDTYLTFYFLKVAIAAAAVYLAEKEKIKDDEKIFLFLVIAIVGLAPGIRDVLRMVCGT